MRKLTGALIGVIVAFVGVSIAAHELIDQDALRQRVAEALKKETGLSMVVKSSTIQILPWPSFEARNLVLQRPGQTPVFQARTVHAGLSVLALLHREVRFQDFVVDGATLSLERDADGNANWTFSQPSRSDAGGAEAPLPVRQHVGERVQAHWDLSLDALHLTNSAVNWRDQAQKMSGSFQIGTMDLAGLRSQSPWINLQGSHGGTPFTVQGHVGDLALLRSGAKPWTFSLGSTLGTDAKRDWLNVDGQIHDASNLRGLVLTAQGEWPNLQDAHRLFPHASLPDMRGLGGDITVQGDAGQVANATWTEKAPVLLASLAPSRIHLHVAGLTVRGTAVSNLHLDADAASAPLSVAADVLWRDTGWRILGKAGTLEQVDLARRDHFHTEVPVEAELRSMPLSLSTALNVEGATPPINAQDDAKVTVSGTVGAEKSRLVVQGGAKALHLPRVLLHDVSLQGTVSSKGLSEATLDDMAFKSREADFDGALHLLTDENSTPLLNGHLHVTQLDLDALRDVWLKEVKATGQQPAKAPPATIPGATGAVEKSAIQPVQMQDQSSVPAVSDAGVVENAAVPSWVKRLRAQDLDLHLTLDRVVFYGHDYTNLATHLTLSDGHLRLEPISGQGQGLTLLGQADLDASHLPVTTHLTFQPLVLPIGLLEEGLGLPLLLQGPVQLVGEVSGQGQTAEDLRQSLSGHLGVSMVDGKVDSQILGRIAGPGADSLLGSGVRPLRCIGLHMALANDTATLDTIGLQSGRFSTAGHGEVRLGSQELQLHLVPSIDFEGAGASTPVIVTGTLSAPQAKQDRDAGGRFQLSIGGEAPADPCTAALAAAREGQAGPPPSEQSHHHNKAGDILRALGVLH
ncbi:AsmA family protein [Gluconobacter cerinus]|uniref:AsmA family protein n=1 Tax=Gluconobacter cerinus TaxID=38307 RepID=UPI001B8D7D3D|nr:AsmA family protein [Gluconobacter cerinus]MBS1068545.1 AsmA family protein [Gluconobacter cerinus]